MNAVINLRVPYFIRNFATNCSALFLERNEGLSTKNEVPKFSFAFILVWRKVAETEAIEHGSRHAVG